MDQLHLYCSGAEVVPESLLIYGVPGQELLSKFIRYRKCSNRRSKKSHGAV